jgi:hypothetical protein
MTAYVTPSQPSVNYSWHFDAFTTSSDAVTSYGKLFSMSDAVKLLVLTPSPCISSLDFWYFAVFFTLCSKNVQNSLFSRIHSPNT